MSYRNEFVAKKKKSPRGRISLEVSLAQFGIKLFWN